MASGKKPTNQHEASWRKVAEANHTIRTGLRYGAWVLLAYILKDPLIELAHGSHDISVTLFSLEVTLGDLAKILPWISTVGLWVLFRNERRLRLRNIEETDHHVKELERNYDPNRTSSRLTQRGRTNPEDDWKGGA